MDVRPGFNPGTRLRSGSGSSLAGDCIETACQCVSFSKWGVVFHRSDVSDNCYQENLTFYNDNYYHSAKVKNIAQ
jgi:pentose-5-phosphate-3-epimerase